MCLLSTAVCNVVFIEILCDEWSWSCQISYLGFTRLLVVVSSRLWTPTRSLPTHWTVSRRLIAVSMSASVYFNATLTVAIVYVIKFHCQPTWTTCYLQSFTRRPFSGIHPPPTSKLPPRILAKSVITTWINIQRGSVNLSP